jgi:hypothetical protein
MRLHRLTPFLVMTAFASCSFAVAARTQDGAAGRSGESQASLAAGTPIYADLKSGLDSKKAKNGDAVNAQTSEAVKSSDGRTILPRGTKLIGHIVQATAKSKGDAQSALAITFDKAILKDGAEVPLSAGIQALASPATFSSSSDAGPPQNTANMGTTQTSPMGRSTPPPDNSQTGAPTGGVPAPGNDQRGLSPNSRGVIGIHGLTLAAAKVDNAVVSTVSSDGKNVHLDSGTRMLLVTQPAPQSPPQ